MHYPVEITVMSVLESFVSFLNASPTPYHAITSAKTLLLKAGFQQLSETSNWSAKSILSPGGKYL